MNKSVAHIKKHRVFLKKRDLREYFWHCHHVCCIKNQHSCVPVVGMIVVRTGENYKIGLLFPDQFDHLKAVLVSWHQLTVVIIECYIPDTNRLTCPPGFFPSPLGKILRFHRLVTGISVCQRHHQHITSRLSPFISTAPHFIRIIRMRADNNNMKLAIR